jgi:hypothetical protein
MCESSRTSARAAVAKFSKNMMGKSSFGNMSDFFIGFSVVMNDLAEI